MYSFLRPQLEGFFPRNLPGTRKAEPGAFFWGARALSDDPRSPRLCPRRPRAPRMQEGKPKNERSYGATMLSPCGEGTPAPQTGTLRVLGDGR